MIGEYKQMRLFEVRANEQLYRYSLMRVAVSVILIGLCIFRGEIVSSESMWLNVILTGISFVICICSILCIYISIGECIHVHENRRRERGKQKNETAKIMTIEEIEKIVSCEDIVEFEVELGKRIAVIGASSEYAKNGFIFTDKRFFIDDQEFDTIEAFVAELFHRFPEGKISVLYMDGLKATDICNENIASQSVS